MENEEDELIRCTVCGEPATKYLPNAVLPICDNTVCYVVRLDMVADMIDNFNKNKGSEYGE